MNRRNFVAGAAGTGASLTLFPPGLTGVEREKGPGGLERRALGRTGEKLSIIGFGGIVVSQATPEEAARRVREAVEAGVNYFDVAPSYGDAEEKLGPALEPHRKGVFLACKTQARTRDAAGAELESSLRRLRTDHFDLYQHHAVTTRSDVATILGPGGAMEAFEAAKQAGKLRFIGFSAHSVEAALALMEGYAFDTLLFPFNYATWHAASFGPQVLARAREKGMGILCLKAMAKGPWPEGAEKRYPKCWYEPLEGGDASLGLRFTLSHPVTAAIPPGDERLFRMALSLAARFEPLSAAEAETVKAKGLAAAPLFRFPSASA
jgi:aryl-alcohol dehydrogenase-like predicted oxidoreductase